jgi:histone H3/H4
MKISKDVFIVLQYYIEQYIISFLEDCNKATVHASRVKLMKADIIFVCSLKKMNEINIENYDIEEGGNEGMKTDNDEQDI